MTVSGLDTNADSRYRIVVIDGDGIGPEVIAATIPVLQSASAVAGFSLQLERRSAGAGEFERTGAAMSNETFEACRTADAVLKGPVGLPGVRTPDGIEAGVLGGILRQGLDLYANLRPIRLLDGVA